VLRPGLAFLLALFLATLALRPQLVAIGPLLPEIKQDLGVAHAVAGLLSTIPVLCLGLFAPLAWPLAGRLGTRRAVAVCVAAIGAFGLARALAPGAAAVLVLTLPIGAAMALAGAMLPVTVKERFSHRPAFATGIYATGIQTGAIIAAAAAVPAAQAAAGWRGSLAVFSLLPLALVVAWLVLTPSAPRAVPERRSFRLPFGSPLVWMLAAVFGLQGVVYHGLNAWLPDIYVEQGWSDARAGALLAVMNVASLPGSLVLPWFADRFGSRRRYLAPAGVLAVVATLGLALVPSLGWLWAACAGFSLSAAFAIALTLPLDVADDPRQVGAVAGLMLAGGYTLSALGPLVLGAARDATGGFAASLWLTVGLSALLVLSTLPLSHERLRRGVEAGRTAAPSGSPG
jgi:CP family cyanate transporter-like MFS transporter